jgi:RimJ/RimL family protein N-acetyltransferase
MTDGIFETREFDPRTADRRELEALNVLYNAIRAETWPDDPPKDVEEMTRIWRSAPEYLDRRLWAVWRENDQMAAIGEVEIYRTEDNQHMAWCEIFVHPEHRRRGLAAGLLAQLTDVAHREKRRLMMGATHSTAPAGEAFAKRLDARPGITVGTNQLEICDLSRDLLREWHERAPEAEFQLGLWTGAYPEEDIAAVVRMREVMNTAPRDDLEIEDRKWTAEQLRQWEAALMERGVELWTLYARHRKSGEIAGYTEVFWNPHEPEILHQGDTGVFPKYRKHGLGRWLKAAMLQKVLDDRPQVRRIRTGNAHSNAPMLKINVELGFKPYKSWTVWQIETERVLQYLQGK